MKKTYKYRCHYCGEGSDLGHPNEACGVCGTVGMWESKKDTKYKKPEKE